MSGEEFTALKREVRRREMAIRTAEYERRIAAADLSRIDMGIATDRAFIANAQAQIDAHWQHTFAPQPVTA